MKDYLQVKNLSFFYNSNTENAGTAAGRTERYVLNNLSFNVKRNSLLCILGPSGCGKTTLLKIIASMIKPSSGCIVLDRQIPDKPDAGRIIIFQDDDQLFPWLDTVKNVGFPLKLSGEKNWYKIASDMLNRVHLAGSEKYYPHELSGGMKKRAIIARALATSPYLLLMDEPFGSLDAQTKKRLHKLILEIMNQISLTVIFVTHDIHEAIFLATDIAVMGKSGDIVYSAENPFTGISDFSSPGFSDFYNSIYAYIDEP